MLSPRGRAADLVSLVVLQTVPTLQTVSSTDVLPESRGNRRRGVAHQRQNNGTERRFSAAPIRILGAMRKETRSMLKMPSAQFRV